MNIIFLDVDGVLCCTGSRLNYDVEKIKLAKEICDENKCSVVLTSARKLCIDEYGNYAPRVQELIKEIKACGIDFLGFTPTIPNLEKPKGYGDMWKEYDINAYLDDNSNVDEFCVIDDDNEGDLESFKDYLVRTNSFEGLMPYHKDEIKKVLKKSKNYRQKIK